MSTLSFVCDPTAPTPSFLDGVAPEIETRLRLYGCEFIQSMAILLAVPQVSVATAEILFHRLYMRKSFKKLNVKNVASACLYLACKIEETERSWKDVLNVVRLLFLRADNRPFAPLNRAIPANDTLYWDMRRDLIVTESHVLKELGFLVQVEHPHKFILSYLNVLGGDNLFAQAAWSLVNDALRTTACVYFRPEAIAVTALFIAARRLGIPLPETPEPWWHLFDVRLDEIESIGFAIIHIHMIPAIYIEV
jgi:transcription initiation factor TFIIIB Brf1 subunit/transcription initiation factor TFIIB